MNREAADVYLQFLWGVFSPEKQAEIQRERRKRSCWHDRMRGRYAYKCPDCGVTDVELKMCGCREEASDANPA